MPKGERTVETPVREVTGYKGPSISIKRGPRALRLMLKGAVGLALVVSMTGEPTPVLSASGSRSDTSDESATACACNYPSPTQEPVLRTQDNRDWSASCACAAYSDGGGDGTSESSGDEWNPGRGIPKPGAKEDKK